MPRRKVSPKRGRGIKLVPPYEPNKGNSELWRQCILNSDLIYCLITGGPPELDGHSDFLDEKERQECWERNREMIMQRKGIGWRGEDPVTSRFGYAAYTVGQRPWAYHHYELKTKFGRKWNERFDPDEFEYLRDHGLLEEGEEALAKQYIDQMTAHHTDSWFIERSKDAEQTEKGAKA